MGVDPRIIRLLIMFMSVLTPPRACVSIRSDAGVAASSSRLVLPFELLPLSSTCTAHPDLFAKDQRFRHAWKSPFPDFVPPMEVSAAKVEAMDV